LGGKCRNCGSGTSHFESVQFGVSALNAANRWPYQFGEQLATIVWYLAAGGVMAYRKTQATEVRKEARRRLLLGAATKLFGKNGYHATTVPMIVAEAGSSTGSFYMYFQSKEDVFNAALEELGKAIEEMLEAVTRSQPDVLKRVSDALETACTFLAQKPEQARILIVESSGLSPRLDKTRRAILVQQEELLRQTLESAPAIFAADNPGVAARCIVGAALETLTRWLEDNPNSRMSASEVARTVAQFNTRALKRASADCL
jgi:AcrR family transcriptional regulator